MILKTLLIADVGIFAAVSQPNDNLIALISNASGPTLMAVIIVGAIKEWWVPGKVHRRIIKERDQLLTLALHGQEMGAKAIELVVSQANDGRSK